MDVRLYSLEMGCRSDEEMIEAGMEVPYSFSHLAYMNRQRAAVVGSLESAITVKVNSRQLQSINQIIYGYHRQNGNVQKKKKMQSRKSVL